MIVLGPALVFGGLVSILRFGNSPETSLNSITVFSNHPWLFLAGFYVWPAYVCQLLFFEQFYPFVWLVLLFLIGATTFANWYLLFAKIDFFSTLGSTYIISLIFNLLLYLFTAFSSV